MTCKDCIHFDVCGGYTLTDDEVPDIEKRCGNFKDKTRFIELPVKLGQIVYAITLNTETNTFGIHRGFIGAFNIRDIGEYMFICHEGLDDEPYFKNICARFEDFGKAIFLTKEEAVQAFKGEGYNRSRKAGHTDRLEP